MTTILTIETEKFSFLASDRAITTGSGQYEIQKWVANTKEDVFVALAGDGSVLRDIKMKMIENANLEWEDCLQSFTNLYWPPATSILAISNGYSYRVNSLMIKCKLNKLYGIGSGADYAIGAFVMPKIKQTMR